jgi:ABC-2 type transport system ATP-binding protein
MMSTGGLDPIQIRHFRTHVRELGQQKTLIISTHILQEVDAIADRVLVIHNGRLVFDGTPHDNLEQQFHELTRDRTGWRDGAPRPAAVEAGDPR